jgi:hypothetical protein
MPSKKRDILAHSPNPGQKAPVLSNVTGRFGGHHAFSPVLLTNRSSSGFWKKLPRFPGQGDIELCESMIRNPAVLE